MQQLMQAVIDGLDFARHGNHVEGQVAIADLLRVAESLASTEGALDCSVEGGRSEDGSGHFELRLRIEGELQLRCQRCLEVMRYPLLLQKRLLLVAPGAEWPEEEVEDESFDVMEASKEMAVGQLIEDEVLLALPISPRHDVCGTPRTKDSRQDASPFAVLRKLKTD